MAEHWWGWRCFQIDINVMLVTTDIRTGNFIILSFVTRTDWLFFFKDKSLNRFNRDCLLNTGFKLLFEALALLLVAVQLEPLWHHFQYCCWISSSCLTPVYSSSKEPRQVAVATWTDWRPKSGWENWAWGSLLIRDEITQMKESRPSDFQIVNFQMKAFVGKQQFIGFTKW